MARETTNAGVLGALGRFDAALETNAADLAHLEGPSTRLRTLLGDARDVFRQQAALIASKQEASKRLLALLTEAQRVATGLRPLLKEHYGLRSEKLAEFGLQPFRGRNRASKTNPESPQQPETSTPDTPAPDPANSLNPKS